MVIAVDQTVLFVESQIGFNIEIRGLEWGTWETKVVGLLDEFDTLGESFQIVSIRLR